MMLYVEEEGERVSLNFYFIFFIIITLFPLLCIILMLAILNNAPNIYSENSHISKKYVLKTLNRWSSLGNKTKQKTTENKLFFLAVYAMLVGSDCKNIHDSFACVASRLEIEISVFWSFDVHFKLKYFLCSSYLTFFLCQAPQKSIS